MQVQLKKWSSLPETLKSQGRTLSIPPEQLEFAGTIESAIALAESKLTSKIVGVAILSASTVVGFLLIKRAGEAPDWVPEDAAIVTALRVGAEYQGSEIGTRAIRQLPSWVARHWHKVASLVLAVDESNHAAIRAYTKAGWTDLGQRVKGRFDWERRMQIAVPNEKLTEPSSQG